MTKIWAIRHALTPANRRGIFGGMSVCLSEEGIMEAKNKATDSRFLDATGGIEVVFCSRYVRSEETAKILFPDAHILVDPLLDEADMGEYTGYTFAEILVRYPEDVRRWLADPEHVPALGGESMRDLRGRVRAFFDGVAGRWSRVAAVTHAGWMRCACALAEPPTDGCFQNLESRVFSIDAPGERIFSERR